MVRGSKAHAGGGGRAAPRSMFETFALEPIWRAYSVCEGEDVQVGVVGVLSGWVCCTTVCRAWWVGEDIVLWLSVL